MTQLQLKLRALETQTTRDYPPSCELGVGCPIALLR